MAEVMEELATTTSIDRPSSRLSGSSSLDGDEDSETLSEVKRRLYMKTPTDVTVKAQALSDSGSQGGEDANKVCNGHNTVNGNSGHEAEETTNGDSAECMETEMDNGVDLDLVDKDEGNSVKDGLVITEVIPDPGENESGEMIDVVIQEVASTDVSKEENKSEEEEKSKEEEKNIEDIVIEECVDNMAMDNVDVSDAKGIVVEPADEEQQFEEEEAVTMQSASSHHAVTMQSPSSASTSPEPTRGDSTNTSDKVEASTSFTTSISKFLGKFSPGRREDPEVTSSKRDGEPLCFQETVSGSSQQSQHEEESRPRPMYFSAVRGRRGVGTPERSLLGTSSETEKKQRLATPVGKPFDDSFVVKSEPPRRSWASAWSERSLRKCDGKRALNAEEDDDQVEQVGKRAKLDPEKPGFLDRWSPFKKRRVNIQAIIPQPETSPSRFSWIYSRLGWKTTEQKMEKDQPSSSDSGSEGVETKTEEVEEAEEAGASSRGCEVM